MLRTLLATALIVATATSLRADDPAPCQVHVILFVPSDSTVPEGYQGRIDQIVTYCEAFFTREFDRWEHEDVVMPFRRSDDGHVEVTVMQGKRAGSEYKPVDVRGEVMDAKRASGEIAEGKPRQVWWMFVYAGDPPKKFKGYLGGFGPKIGGWAVCNFDTTPGKIDPKEPLGSEFLANLTLKGMIHELGHGFQLPHIGPLMRDDAGNTLMGPTHFNYKRQFPAGTKYVYLCETEAAMLAVHPAFRGVPDDRAGLPRPQVQNLQYRSDTKNHRIIVSGRVRAQEQKPVYAFVADESDARPGEYWTRTYVGEVAPNGEFEVVLTEPAEAGGTLKTWFAFENGAQTGNGRQRGRTGGIAQKYTYARKRWVFE